MTSGWPLGASGRPGDGHLGHLVSHLGRPDGNLGSLAGYLEPLDGDLEPLNYHLHLQLPLKA